MRGWIDLVRYVKDPMGFLERVGADSRPLVPFSLGSLQCYMAKDPAYIAEALHSQAWPPLTRGRMAHIKDWYEGGLAVETGERHACFRDEMWLPVMKDPWLLETAVAEAVRWTDGWKDGQPIEAYEEFRKMTYTICWKGITGEDLATRPGLYDTMAAGDHWLGALVGPLGPLRWRLPTPESAKGHRQRALMDSTVNELVAERKKVKTQDLLSRFVESGERMGATGADYRGTIKAWFGAENLHTHTAWTCYLLGKNPDAQKLLHEELDRVLGDRDPTPDDLPALDYTRRVTKESLRLFPSVPAFFRGIEGDFKLGNDIVPSGSLLGFAPWVLHRDPRYWAEPQRFDPDRWLPDKPKPPAYTYIPFATGDYQCPGTAKSIKEGPLVLAAIARKWRMVQPKGARTPIAAATWSLQAKGGIPLQVSRRTS